MLDMIGLNEEDAGIAPVVGAIVLVLIVAALSTDGDVLIYRIG